MPNTKLTDGLNDRSKDAPISQTAEGSPDDSAKPMEVDEATVDAVRKKLESDPSDDLVKTVKQEEDASRIGLE